MTAADRHGRAQAGCCAALYGALAAPQPNLGPRVYAYEVVQEFPHDPKAFTQGLEHEYKCVKSPTGHPIPECSDVLWESTGGAGLPVPAPQVLVRHLQVKAWQVQQCHGCWQAGTRCPCSGQ